jgi:hypothetical protein
VPGTVGGVPRVYLVRLGGAARAARRARREGELRKLDATRCVTRITKLAVNTERLARSSQTPSAATALIFPMISSSITSTITSMADSPTEALVFERCRMDQIVAFSLDFEHSIPK